MWRGLTSQGIKKIRSLDAILQCGYFSADILMVNHKDTRKHSDEQATRSKPQCFIGLGGVRVGLGVRNLGSQIATLFSESHVRLL